jgi:hypothetical protein
MRHYQCKLALNAIRQQHCDALLIASKTGDPMVFPGTTIGEMLCRRRRNEEKKPPLPPPLKPAGARRHC